MSKHSPDKLTRQARFVRSCVNTLMRNKEVAQICVQNKDCAVTITRDTPEVRRNRMGFDTTYAVGGSTVESDGIYDNYCDGERTDSNNN